MSESTKLAVEMMSASDLAQASDCAHAKSEGWAVSKISKFDFNGSHNPLASNTTMAINMALDLIEEHRFELDTSEKYPYVPNDVFATVRNVESLSFVPLNSPPDKRLSWFKALICRALHRDEADGSTRFFIERPDQIVGELVNWLLSFHRFDVTIGPGACGSVNVKVGWKPTGATSVAAAK